MITWVRHLIKLFRLTRTSSQLNLPLPYKTERGKRTNPRKHARRNRSKLLTHHSIKHGQTVLICCILRFKITHLFRNTCKCAGNDNLKNVCTDLGTFWRSDPQSHLERALPSALKRLAIIPKIWKWLKTLAKLKLYLIE